MRRLLHLAGVAIIATLLLSACSNSDEDTGLTPPTPVNPDSVMPSPAEGNDQRPAWKAPDNPRSYEGMTMTVQIGLQKELLSYVSQEDLVCAMLSGEVRAVSGVKETGGQYYFPLSILGNSGEGAVTLKYYCDKLHRIFTVSDWKTFDPSVEPTVDGVPYEVKFYTGN